MRELAARTIDTQPIVAVNALTPGFCKTSLARNAQGTATLVMFGLVLGTVRALVGWSAEVGSRNLVYAATLGVESHGQFFGGGDVKRQVTDHCCVRG
jgi:retinol dehydrogenase-12